jgi:hypothetical protein
MEIACGFFYGRDHVDFRPINSSNDDKDYILNKNVTRIIATLVLSKICSLHELDTIYGMKDAYDMLEIIQVDNYNSRG